MAKQAGVEPAFSIQLRFYSLGKSDDTASQNLVALAGVEPTFNPVMRYLLRRQCQYKAVTVYKYRPE